MNQRPGSLYDTQKRSQITKSPIHRRLYCIRSLQVDLYSSVIVNICANISSPPAADHLLITGIIRHEQARATVTNHVRKKMVVVGNLSRGFRLVASRAGLSSLAAGPRRGGQSKMSRIPRTWLCRYGFRRRSSTGAVH